MGSRVVRLSGLTKMGGGGRGRDRRGVAAPNSSTEQGLWKIWGDRAGQLREGEHSAAHLLGSGVQAAGSSSGSYRCVSTTATHEHRGSRLAELPPLSPPLAPLARAVRAPSSQLPAPSTPAAGKKKKKDRHVQSGSSPTASSGVAPDTAATNTHTPPTNNTAFQGVAEKKALG